MIGASVRARAASGINSPSGDPARQCDCGFILESTHGGNVRGHAMDYMITWRDRVPMAGAMPIVLPLLQTYGSWPRWWATGGDPECAQPTCPLHVARGPRENRCSSLWSSGQASGLEQPTTITAKSKKALARWSRRSGRRRLVPAPTALSAAAQKTVM